VRQGWGSSRGVYSCLSLQFASSSSSVGCWIDLPVAGKLMLPALLGYITCVMLSRSDVQQSCPGGTGVALSTS
jgi:hypothetical protein